MATRTKPQSFDERDFFPSFRACPAEHDLDDRYYVAHNGRSGTYRKHWCLLGDIIEAENLIRPRIVAKDYNGDQFIVAFYPNNPGDMPRILKNFKVGNTIAIFYPLVHIFLDGTIGVRVEDSNTVLTIPLKFADVINMNKEVIKHVPAEGAQQRCHNCNETNDSLSTCARCTLFAYCNKDCQAKAWNEKDHKKFCKVLKDENVRRMHFLSYETYQGSIAFK